MHLLFLCLRLQKKFNFIVFISYLADTLENSSQKEEGEDLPVLDSMNGYRTRLTGPLPTVETVCGKTQGYTNPEVNGNIILSE